MPVASGRTPNPLLLEYICSRCGVLLKSTEAQIDRLDVDEDCPSCGTALSKTLALKNQKRQSVSQTAKLSPPEFKLASTYPRLKFGNPTLDKTLPPLMTGDMLCISGPHATSLLEVICCQTLLPLRDGGLDSERVIYLDAGNTSQIYRFVRLARLAGLDYRDALRRVVQTRTFTIHQLASVVINELASAADTARAKAVFISDLFELFLREPNLDAKEAERLASEMAQELSRLSSNHVLAISITRPSPYDRFLFAGSSVKRLVLACSSQLCHYYSYGQHKISLQVPENTLLAEV